MGCRYCGEDVRIETQEHLEQCEGFSYEQRGLNFTKEKGKQIFWRRMAPKLKKIDDEKKYIALKALMKRKKEEQALKKTIPKPVVVTKVAKAKPLAKTAAALKETLLVSADKRKNKTLRTIVV